MQRAGARKQERFLAARRLGGEVRRRAKFGGRGKERGRRSTPLRLLLPLSGCLLAVDSGTSITGRKSPVRGSLAVPTRSLHWLRAERSGVNDSAGEGRGRGEGGREPRQMPEPETEGRRLRRREVVQEEGKQRLKRRKKKSRRWPFPETHRQTEPRRWRSEPSSQPGRSCLLTLNWVEGVQPQASGEEASLGSWRIFPRAQLGNTCPSTRAFTPNVKPSLLDRRSLSTPRYGAQVPWAGKASSGWAFFETRAYELLAVC